MVHLVQFMLFRGYVPVILTTLPATLYCMYSLQRLNGHGLLDWEQVILWAAFFSVAVAANLALALALVKRFNLWLIRYTDGVEKR